MKSSLTNLFQTTTPGQNPKTKKFHPAGTFFICLLVAAFSWLLTILAKDYDQKISYKVSYLNLPAGRTMLNPLPDTLSLGLNANGFALLGTWFNSGKHTLLIDFMQITDKMQLQMDNEIRIPSGDLILELSPQLSSSVTLSSIRPDTLILNFSERVSKRLAVRPKFHLSFEQNCDTSGMILRIPDSVTAFGPVEELKGLEFIETAEENFSGLNRSVQKKMMLLHNNKISLMPDSVTISIPVEKFTGKESEISVQQINVPAGFRVKLIPGKVKISYLVSLKNFHRVSDVQFLVEADLAEAGKTGSGKIKLTLKESPAGVKRIKIIPPTAEYILIK